MLSIVWDFLVCLEVFFGEVLGGLALFCFVFLKRSFAHLILSTNENYHMDSNLLLSKKLYLVHGLFTVIPRYFLPQRIL